MVALSKDGVKEIVEILNEFNFKQLEWNRQGVGDG